MPIARIRSVLSGLKVKEAMRRQIVSVRSNETAYSGISRMIKYKSDVLLVTDTLGAAAGLVSKTDMTGAFYAGLPVDTALGDMMVGPLLACFPDDPLEDALATMAGQKVHQLFVKGADAGYFEGMLTYGDILGLVYRYCRHCRKSRCHHPAAIAETQAPVETRVTEVMTPSVIGCRTDNPLTAVMEIIASRRMSAVLVSDAAGKPAGVISKSDLVMAWHCGVAAQAPAHQVMSTPVRSCSRQATLTEAMTRMLLEDLGRIFVHDPESKRIVGVVSLADAANHRSGTCRACVSSRMIGQADRGGS